MNVFVLTTVVMLATFAVGLLLMALFVNASQAVVTNRVEVENREREEQAVNPAATAGFAIPTNRSVEEQVLAARKLAARRAAALPRGANMGIGRQGTTDAHEVKKHTTVGIEADPISAVKVAQFHTWSGLQYVSPTQVAAQPIARPTGKMVQRELVPGEDYEVVPVPGTPGPERRQAIIANAKAKSAAYKALRDSGQLMVEATAAAPAPTAAATAPAATAAPAAASVPEPELIEITDDMSKDEQRRAKIANAKAQSAYKKALKAAGIDPSSAPATVAAPAAAPAAEAAPAAPAAPEANMPPPPDLIEITDDMPNDEQRQAKIANAKAKSAYKKALKAAGIDPSTVDI